MSPAHVCDECKTVAPLDEAYGWWRVCAMETPAGVLLEMMQKAEYHFCSWGCLAEFFHRRTLIAEGSAR